jgi:hypothetical protein
MRRDVLEYAMKHGRRQPPRIRIISRTVITAEKFAAVTYIDNRAVSEFALGRLQAERANHRVECNLA